MTINVLFVITAAVFLACLIIGFKSGFLKEISFLFSAAAASALVIIFINPISGFICDNTQIDERVVEVVSDKLTGLLPEGMTAEDTSLLPRLSQMSLLESAPFPEAVKSLRGENNNDSMYEALGISNFVDYVSVYVAHIIMRIISFIIGFLVILLILRLIFRSVEAFTNTELIAGLNHMLGGFVGIATFVVIIWVFFLVITLMCTTSWGQGLMNQVEENEILKRLYDSNLLLTCLSRLR